jgi:hypothetical protein
LTGVNFMLIFHDGPAQTAIGTQVTSPDNPLSGSALDAAGRRIQKRALFHPTERRRDAICLAVYVWPVLATAQQCMRAPEMWAVEVLVMRFARAVGRGLAAAPSRAAREQQGSCDLLLIKRGK